MVSRNLNLTWTAIASWAPFAFVDVCRATWVAAPVIGAWRSNFISPWCYCFLRYRVNLPCLCFLLCALCLELCAVRLFVFCCCFFICLWMCSARVNGREGTLGNAQRGSVDLRTLSMTRQWMNKRHFENSIYLLQSDILLLVWILEIWCRNPYFVVPYFPLVSVSCEWLTTFF